MEENEMQCLLCEEEFDDDGDRLPRMFPECGHSVCQLCIQAAIQTNDPICCPEDYMVSSAATANSLNGEIERKSDTQSTHASEQISTPRCATTHSEESLPPTPRSVFDERLCHEHQKRIDIICVDCFQKICASCALFGKHRGHFFRSEEEVLKEITFRAGELLQMIESIEKKQCYLTDETHSRTIKEYILSNLKNVEEEIHLKFQVNNQLIQQEIEDLVKAKKEKSLLEVKERFLESELRCIQFLKDAPRDAIESAEKWKEEAKKKLLFLCEENNFDSYSLDLMLDPRNRKQSDIIWEGGELLKCIEQANQNLDKQLEEFQFETVKIEFTPDYGAFINNIISVSSRQDNELSNLLHTKKRILFEEPLSNQEINLTKQYIGAFQGKLDRKLSDAPSQSQHYMVFPNSKDNGSGLNSRNDSIHLLPQRKEDSQNGSPERQQKVQVSNYARQKGTGLEVVNSESKFLTFNQNSISGKKTQSNLFQNGELTEDNLLNDDLHDQFNDSILFTTKNINNFKFSTSDFLGKGQNQHFQSELLDNSLLIKSQLHEPQLLDDIESELFGGKIIETDISGSIEVQSSLSTQKKHRSLAVPLSEKFQPVLNDILKDLIDSADFAFADMGDEGLIGVADALEKNKQLRTLKLQRNKISDKGAVDLLECILRNQVQIYTLFLQDNMISDKFLEFLLNKYKSMAEADRTQHLSIIYLKNNLLNLSKAQRIAEELSKYQVSIQLT